MNMQVAVISNRNRPGFADDNQQDHVAWIRRAAEAGARLVLFPELSLSGYTTEGFVRRSAMSLQHKRCRALLRVAQEHEIYVAFGMPLRQQGKLFISHVLVGPSGLVGHYEKVHLAGPLYGEGKVFHPGSEFRVFDVDGARVGINICYDGRHPGSSLATAHLGAEIILHPHGNYVGDLGANPLDWTENKRAYLAARAVDTCTYTLICNSVGNLRDPLGHVHRYSGGAVILDPEGCYVARSPSSRRQPHMIVADLDMDALRQRRAGSSFSERRTDIYATALSTESNA
jgi:N-carbamoylputrescine amidase